MAKIDLLELEETGMVGSLEGQKIILYGTNDQGKTKQAAKLPKPLLFMTENGGNAVRCPKIEVTKWATFKDYVKQLTNEKTLDKMKERYQCILIDTLQNLVELCEQATCLEFGVRDLSEINGKQNGYSLSRRDFKNQINTLCSFGYTVVFLDHEEVIEKEDELTGEKYNFTQPKGTSNVKSSTRFVRDLCDFCFFVSGGKVLADGTEVFSNALCKQTRNAFARSRYDIQSFISPFSAKNMEEAIIKAIEKSAENEGAEIEAWKPDTSSYTANDWIGMIQPYFKAIYRKYPEVVNQFVAEQLGDGVKVSQATDEQLVELENIYNKMVSYACEMGIVVEI